MLTNLLSSRACSGSRVSPRVTHHEASTANAQAFSLLALLPLSSREATIGSALTLCTRVHCIRHMIVGRGLAKKKKKNMWIPQFL